MGQRNYDDVASRWIKVLRGIETTNFKNDRMPVIGDVIHSYGSHFPLAQPVRDRKGNLTHFVLNGDRFSVTTNKHQAIVRSAVAGSGYPSVIVPFSALSEAGIDVSTVRIVEVTQDRWEDIETVVHEQPAGSRWVYDQEYVPGSRGWRHRVTGEWRDGDSWSRPETPGKPTWSIDRSTDEYNAAYREWRERDDQWEFQYGVQKHTGRKDLVSGPHGHRRWELFEDENGEVAYRSTHVRHWLGEALIEGTVRYWKAVKCKLCGGKGEVEGVTRRQRSPIIGPAQWEYERYPVVGTIDVPSCEGCGGAGTVTARRSRKAYFLSAFDRNESRPSYFFCELPPKVKPQTIEEALETLKPETVRLAEQMGRDVKRQGDIFAVPVPSLTTRALSQSGAKREKGLPLFNTNHVVTEQVTLPNGQTFARGTLRHDPQWRRPDHKRVTIGKEWHLILKNTVPTAA